MSFSIPIKFCNLHRYFHQNYVLVFFMFQAICFAKVSKQSFKLNCNFRNVLFKKKDKSQVKFEIKKANHWTHVLNKIKESVLPFGFVKDYEKEINQY